MAKSKTSDKSTLDSVISQYYEGNPFSYYSLSSTCPSEKEMKELIEEINKDRPKPNDKRVTLLRKYLGQCVSCYLYHIFNSNKDVREKVNKETTRVNKEALEGFRKDKNLNKLVEKTRPPIDPILSKDFAKLLDIMDAICVVLEQPLIRFKYGNGISIDSLKRMDDLWAFVGNHIPRVNEILFPQAQQTEKIVFPAKRSRTWWKKLGEFFIRHWKWLIAAIIVPIVGTNNCIACNKAVGELRREGVRGKL